jgi:hypothetical protein
MVLILRKGSRYRIFSGRIGKNWINAVARIAWGNGYSRWIVMIANFPMIPSADLLVSASWVLSRLAADAIAWGVKTTPAL